MTITAVPDTFASVHDDLIYTVTQPAKTSDPNTYPNYKFICDVYVSGVLQARVKKVPDGNGVGVFNICKIVQNYITTQFNPGSALLAQQMGDGNFRVTVQVVFGEEYAYTQYYNQLSDSTRFFYNHYNKNLVGNASALTNKISMFATNLIGPRYTLLSTTHLLVSYITQIATTINYEIDTSDGKIITGTFDTPDGMLMNVLNVSPVAINALTANTITTATEWYTFRFGSISITVNIICESQYQVYPVHFLNQYGGFETKLFTKVSKTTVSVSKKDFSKPEYIIGADGSVSYFNANNVYNEVGYTYASEFTEQLQLNSDLLTDAEYRWLYDLIVSPIIYIQNGMYQLPYKIIDTNYELKKIINDNTLSNLTINVSNSKSLNAQYR